MNRRTNNEKFYNFNSNEKNFNENLNEVKTQKPSYDLNKTNNKPYNIFKIKNSSEEVLNNDIEDNMNENDKESLNEKHSDNEESLNENYSDDDEILSSKDLLEEVKDYSSSKDVEIPTLLIDQIIGHEEAVETIKKAAKQRRNVLLIGEPGVGKSMLAKGMAQLLPMEELKDVLVYPNPEDSNNPLVRMVPAGEGRAIVSLNKNSAKGYEEKKTLVAVILVVAIVAIGIYSNQIIGAVIAVGILLLLMMQIKPKSTAMGPKLLVNNVDEKFAPFLDATGSHAGALLGDVRHDPYQSGGLGTPAHERVEPGMIHKAHKGVLYIDEIGTMGMKTQQELLSAMQEKVYPITGQSENSSGAMVRSEAVPCDFVLVASGNIKVLENMHIAMRSRIRGYGYEVFMKDSMPDNTENRKKLIQFVAQEINNDGRIPHFNKEALNEIIREAQRRSGKKDSLTLRLRDLGGLVRASGDIAKENNADIVTSDHVIEAKKLARTLEQQIADRYIVQRKDYSVFSQEGGKVGVINGLAVIGDSGGLISPIAAEATPSQSKKEGKIIATGKLGEIAKESVQNVSALIKKHTGTDISNYDIHIQFLQTYDGVEGDSASVSIAAAVISALEEIPIDQSVALTGSLTVRGDVLPIGGVTSKIEAAAEAGIKKVLIPRSNFKDVMIEKRYENKIEIVPCDTLADVLDNILVGNKKSKLLDRMKKMKDMVSTDISKEIIKNRLPKPSQ